MTGNQTNREMAAYYEVSDRLISGEENAAVEMLSKTIQEGARRIYREISDAGTVVVDNSKQRITESAEADETVIETPEAAPEALPAVADETEQESMDGISLEGVSVADLVNEAATRVPGFDEKSEDEQKRICYSIAKRFGLLEAIQAEAAAETEAVDDRLPTEIIESYTSTIENFDEYTDEQKFDIRMKIAEELDIMEDLKDEVKQSNDRLQAYDNEVDAEEAMGEENDDDAVPGEEEGEENDPVTDELASEFVGDEDSAEPEEGEAVFSDEALADAVKDLSDKIDTAIDDIESIEDNQDTMLKTMDDLTAEFEKTLGGFAEDLVDENPPEGEDAESENEVEADGVEFEDEAGEVGDEAAVAMPESVEVDEESAVREYLQSVMKRKNEKLDEYTKKVKPGKKPMADNNKSVVPSPGFSSIPGFERKRFTIGGGNEKGRKAPTAKDMGGTTEPNVKTVKTPVLPKKAKGKDGQKSVMGS